METEYKRITTQYFTKKLVAINIISAIIGLLWSYIVSSILIAPNPIEK